MVVDAIKYNISTQLKHEPCPPIQPHTTCVLLCRVGTNPMIAPSRFYTKSKRIRPNPYNKDFCVDLRYADQPSRADLRKAVGECLDFRSLRRQLSTGQTMKKIFSSVPYGVLHIRAVHGRYHEWCCSIRVRARSTLWLFQGPVPHWSL